MLVCFLVQIQYGGMVAIFVLVTRAVANIWKTIQDRLLITDSDE